jgi:hypothetical protein
MSKSKTEQLDAFDGNTGIYGVVIGVSGEVIKAFALLAHQLHVLVIVSRNMGIP